MEQVSTPSPIMVQLPNTATQQLLSKSQMTGQNCAISNQKVSTTPQMMRPENFNPFAQQSIQNFQQQHMEHQHITSLQSLQNSIYMQQQLQHEAIQQQKNQCHHLEQQR